MKQYFTEKNGNSLKTPQSDVSRFVVPFAGTLQAIDYYSPNSAPGRGTNICQTRLNGVAIFADVDRPEFFQSISKTGLSVAVVPGDVISTDLDQVGLIRPYLEICYHLDDGALIASSIHALSDVDDTGKSTGKVLQYNGTLWVPATPAAGASSLHALTDVNDTGKSTGQVLTYNGTAWVPVTPATGGAGFTYYEPDVPYGTPSAFDDEFNAGSLDGKWTTYNVLPTLSFTAPNSGMNVVPSNASQVRGIYQTPTWANGDTYIMKLRLPIRTGVGFDIGFLVIDAAGSIYTFTGGVGNASMSYTWNFWVSNSSLYSGQGAIANTIDPRSLYLKMVYDASGTKKLVFYGSGDCVIWNKLLDTSAGGFPIDNSGAPQKFGIVAYGTTTSEPVVVDWIRKQQSTYPGALITV